MKLRELMLTILFVFGFLLTGAQTEDNAIYLTVTGQVVEENSGEPMEFATVVLLDPSDSSQVAGMATGSDGHFQLQADKPGSYIFQVSFIGFNTINKNIKLEYESGTVDLGDFKLTEDIAALEEVEVRASEYSVNYEIDRKVINVEEQYSFLSGNAADILQNQPSINVDIDGNVSLRGNSSLTVLIDGRPTILQANDALRQIPASSIKSIEIITNPSAKFDPQGTGGIINIVTRRNAMEGMSGIVHLNSGLYDKYGGDILGNYKTRDFRIFIGGDYDHESNPGFMELENHTYNNDTTFYLLMDGYRKRKDLDYNVRAGFEWYMSEKATISLSGRYGGGVDNNIANTGYNEWNSFNEVRNQYSNEQDNERNRDFFALNSNFTYEFDSAKHRLDADIMLFRFDGGEDNGNTLYNDNETIRSGQRSLEGGPAEGLNYRVNYVNSFSELIGIEMGAQGRIRNSNDWNEMYYYDTGVENYILQERFSHESFYDQHIHAGYALVKGELKKFAYQLGIRGEYTNRRISINDMEETFTINRWDYFPTIHASYQLPYNQQLMASYTRRIDRPRSWAMEPFYTWQDAYNIRRGNPELEPEYIDSYELGYQNDFNNNSLSVELYYRKTKNLIERIQSVYDKNIMLRTFDSVGQDYSLGVETMFNFSIKKWWENSLNGNFFHYRVEGEINDKPFDRRSFSWSVNWNQTFHITGNTQIQLNPEYEGPEVEAQEREKGSFELDGAIRQSLWNDKVRLTLQARDILSTDRYESVIDEPEFYNFRRFWRKTPVFMLNLTWNINTIN